LTDFPETILPYRPVATVEVPLPDLEALLGVRPAGAASVPALTGTLARGEELARTGDSVIAASLEVGRGNVTLIGFDPAVVLAEDTPISGRLWGDVVPSAGDRIDPLEETDDSFIVNALGNLPAVNLPSTDGLLLLVLLYVLVIGPVNYVILRRRDRREWAWVSMPLTIVIFAVGAYAVGSAGRGANVVVNELAVVSGAAGGESGIVQSYVGVFSPSRSQFTVRVHGDPLLFAPSQGQRFGPDVPQEGPLSVLLGDPATIRDFGVGFGSIRAFRAQAQFPTPRVEADLELVGADVVGTVTNLSDVTLSSVTVLHTGGYDNVGDIPAGESRPVQFRLRGVNQFQSRLADLIVPDPGSNTDDIRRVLARRAVIQHLSGGWGEFGAAPSGALTGGPTILAWASGPTLQVDVGGADHVGERLYLLSADLSLSGPVTFSGSLIQRNVVAADAVELMDDGPLLAFGRGTVEVEFFPAGVERDFQASELALVLRAGFDDAPPAATAAALAPLPATEQPNQDDPLAADPRPAEAIGVPRIQLFDRVAGAWVEFEPVEAEESFLIQEPERYVDASGSFRVRYVVRDPGAYVEFSMGVRLEGIIE
jgi:hypothetical protein